MQQDRLAFLICLPRTGSTMLADCLGLHSRMYCPPEPHLLYPALHLGYFRRMYNEEVAPGPATNAICSLVAHLPNGAEDYLDAIRAYANVIYERLLKKSKKDIFVDKSPTYTANGYLRLIERIYPKAKYVLIVRDPVDVALSMYRVGSLWGWGEGQTKTWNVLNRVTEGFATLSDFVARRPDACVIRYEDLVESPQPNVENVCRFLEIDFEPAMMERERYPSEYWVGLGDPKTLLHRRRIGEPATPNPMASTATTKFYEKQLLSALSALDPRTYEMFGYSATHVMDRIHTQIKN